MNSIRCISVAVSLLFSVLTDAQVKVIEVLEIEDFGSFVIDEAPGIVTADGNVLCSGIVADLTQSQVLSLLNEKLSSFSDEQKMEILRKKNHIKRYLVHSGGYFEVSLAGNLYDRNIDYAALKSDEISSLAPTLFSQESNTNNAYWWIITPSTTFEEALTLKSYTIEFTATDVSGNTINRTSEGAFQNGLLVNNCGQVMAMYHNKNNENSRYLLMYSEQLQGYSLQAAPACDSGSQPDAVHTETLPEHTTTITTSGGGNGNQQTTIISSNVQSDSMLSVLLDSYIDSLSMHDSIAMHLVENMESAFEERLEEADSKFNLVFILVGGLFLVVVIGVVYVILNKRGKAKVETPVQQPESTHVSEPASIIGSEIQVTSKGLNIIDESGIFGGNALSISGEMTFGRSSSNDFSCADAITQISRKHAVIKRDGENLFIKDVGSSNGTFINDERIDADEYVRLDSGDSIYLGKARFSLKVH